MLVTDEFRRVLISDISVNREGRQRRDLSVDDLVASIRQHGLYTPIIVTRQLELIAGERRLEACRQLGLPDIPVRFVDQCSEIELQIIELEENIKRQDLVWQDLCRAINRVHDLHIAADESWSMDQTCAVIGLTKGTLSIHLKVGPELDNPRIAGASGLREAYNILGRRDSRLAGEALAEILEVVNEIAPLGDSPQPLGPLGEVNDEREVAAAPARPKAPSEDETILQASFLDWAPTYSGRKFNLVHCDFPYGIEAFAGPQAGADRDLAGAYDDNPDVYWQLLECFCEHLDKFMAVNAHLMFWYSAKHSRRTLDTFQRLAPSLVFHPYDLIWVKSDNSGIASDPRRTPRHVYETCLFASRGGRQIVQIVSDAVAASTDKRWHVSTKPEGMLRHFMTMLVDESTSLLDPTCGSGAAIRAAEGLGAVRTLGLEINPEHCKNARLALRNSRLLRAANKEL